jgi:hypothetical protein
MILITDPKWRAVRLENTASVTYLNRLLRQGWYLMRLDVDGLAYLGFEVPTEPPSWTTPRSVHQIVDAQHMPRMSVIVLTNGNRKDLQRAIYMMPDDSGHFDLSTVELNANEWGHVGSFLLEDGNRMELFERGDFGRSLSLVRFRKI